MPPILHLEIQDGRLFEDAVEEIAKLGMNATLHFSPEGLSLTVEDEGKVAAGLRIFANGGGCRRFSCSESFYSRLNLFRLVGTILKATKGGNGGSSLSISIEIDPSPETIEEGSVPANLGVFWLNPPNPSAPETSGQESVAADNKLSLQLRKVDNQDTLLKSDESKYEAAAGLSPGAIIFLDKKLQDLMKRSGRKEEDTSVMLLITPDKLGFFTCRNGWVHKQEEEFDDVVEVFWKDGAVKDIRMGVYSVGLLRAHMYSANTVNAGILWIYIQHGLPIVMRIPLCDGELGTLYFFSTDPPPYQLQLPLFHPLMFEFVKSL